MGVVLERSSGSSPEPLSLTISDVLKLTQEMLGMRTGGEVMFRVRIHIRRTEGKWENYFFPISLGSKSLLLKRNYILIYFCMKFLEV